MSSLVADYGDSSDSNSSSGESSQIQEKESLTLPVEPEKLPLPKFGEEGILSVTNSVFKNPFVEEENAKSAILEKHVKMIPAKDDITKINGKQICWMYRKGRCRFGHNCKFAHDSDLYSENTAEAGEQSELSLTNETLPPGSVSKNDKGDVLVETEGPKKKKRPGLSQGLVPGKKVMKMYKKQQLSGSNKV